MEKGCHIMLENMGPASREEIESFAAYVLEALGYDGFEMRWTTAGSICMKRSILIDESFISKYRWQAKEIVLHEIAHIDTSGADHMHGNVFYTRYVELLKRFMCRGEGEMAERDGKYIVLELTEEEAVVLAEAWRCLLRLALGEAVTPCLPNRGALVRLHGSLVGMLMQVAVRMEGFPTSSDVEEWLRGEENE